MILFTAPIPQMPLVLIQSYKSTMYTLYAVTFWAGRKCQGNQREIIPSTRVYQAEGTTESDSYKLHVKYIHLYLQLNISFLWHFTEGIYDSIHEWPRIIFFSVSTLNPLPLNLSMFSHSNSKLAIRLALAHRMWVNPIQTEAWKSSME